MRVTGFVDGFNLYHSVKDSGHSHLKWLDLWKLCEMFAPAPQYELTGVLYFTAYATHRPNAVKRHRVYVEALRAVGVQPVIGHFKRKQAGCRSCGSTWPRHEEKETDVNLALRLFERAYADSYDMALLITADSDIVPAVRMTLASFPAKTIRVLTPLDRPHGRELLQASGQKARKIRRPHLEQSLLPERVADSSGQVVAIRPSEYDPPT